MMKSSYERETQHYDVRTETFLVKHDLTFMRDSLINKRLSLKHIESFCPDTPKFDQLCQTLGLDFCQQVKLGVALEEKSKEDNLDKEFQQQRKKYIVTTTDKRYLQIYHQHAKDFTTNTHKENPQNTTNSNSTSQAYTCSYATASATNDTYNDFDITSQANPKRSNINYNSPPSKALLSGGDANSRQRTMTQDFIEDYLPKLNVMIVGEAGVGKTTMLFKMCKEDYIFKPSNVEETVGIDMEEVMVDIGQLESKVESKVELQLESQLESKLESEAKTQSDKDIGINDNNNIVLLQIWDSAGMEKYHSDVMSPLTLRMQNGIVLCYDVGDKKSFAALTDRYKNIMACIDANNVAILIVGCKKDTIHDGNGDRYVLSKEAKKYAASIGASCSDCSAKTGQGIVETLLLITERAYKRKRWSDQQNDRAMVQFPPLIDLNRNVNNGESTRCQPCCGK